MSLTYIILLSSIMSIIAYLIWLFLINKKLNDVEELLKVITETLKGTKKSIGDASKVIKEHTESMNQEQPNDQKSKSR